MSIKKLSLLFLVVLTAGAIAFRAFQTSPEQGGSSETSSGIGDALSDATGSSGGPAKGYLPGNPGSGPESSLGTSGGSSGGGSGDGVMPYVTEGGFFALIGYALGYLSKKVLKLALILLALIFLAVQGMAYTEVLYIDWDRAQDLFNRFVLNIQENQSIGEIIKHKLPTAGGLVAGYALGFRKG